jgi:hypothetical protein
MGVYSGVAQDNVLINSGRASLETLNAKAIGVASPGALRTANFAVGPFETAFVCNGAASITVTLPDPALNAGRILLIKTIAAQTVVSAGSNVRPANSNTAGTAILAATAGAWAMLVSDGTAWVIMAS